tara:strand:- start:804 stop:1328 length:525 start_codon:yes stop_codon:yes gene_type:complete
MALNTDIFRSEGGFGVGSKTIVSDEFDIKNANSLEVKNSQFQNCSRTDFVLKTVTNAATPTKILSKLSASVSPIVLPNGSVNFITSHVVGTNTNGSGYYAVKFENIVAVDAIGGVDTVGSLVTVVKDSIPSGEGWSVTVYDSGNAGEFSFTANQGVAPGDITWAAHSQVITVDW